MGSNKDMCCIFWSARKLMLLY